MEKSIKNPAISSRKSKGEENFFKTNLKWFRENSNLTQKSLSEATGLERAAIGAYEEGRAYPRLTALITLADYFGIRIDELVREAKRPTVIDNSEFGHFAKTHIVFNRFISRSDLYKSYLEIVPRTTAQSFKNQLFDWCKENGFELNPSEYIDKHGRIVIRHNGKTAEFFFIKKLESEVSNA